MRTQLFAFGCAYLVAFLYAVEAPTAERPVRVELTSTSDDYVIGQPVILIVTVTNIGKDEIQPLVGVLKYQIGIYISSDGAKFEQYTRGDQWHISVLPPMERVEPGESKAYVFRVLYTFYSKETRERRSHLVFDKPGVYFIKAHYPLYPKREIFPSNTIRVRIRQPEGVDAKVWKEINSREFLYFLRSGEPNSVLRDYGDTPLKAAKLLQSIPKSSYTPALRYALEKRYHQRRRPHMTRQQAMEDPELKLIRSVTGIEEPPDGPFPDDPRLDVKITYHFAELTPLEEVFKEISKQSGVPLRLAPQLRIQRMKGGPNTRSLRQLMIILDGEGSNWMRDGHGYRLVPAREPI